MATNLQEIIVNYSPSPKTSCKVGILAMENQRIFFEYDSAWLQKGIELSPFTLPLQTGLVEHKDHDFGPLFGLFDDSLPDGWGLLLMDRHFRTLGINLATVTPLERLLYIGRTAMGALVYHPPTNSLHSKYCELNLHELCNQAKLVYEGKEADILPSLFLAGGSPGGARPKVLIGYNEQKQILISGEGDLPPGYRHWLIKFPAKEDGIDSGLVEYVYAQMARRAGVQMAETRIFYSEKDEPFFGVKRFDRKKNNQRIHTHTFGNLIQSNFRIPSCDYDDLFKVTTLLTRNQMDLEQAFRLMIFNILTHNRDDHVKNFSFTLNDENNSWNLSPAYDLTYSNGPGGEHSLTIAGHGSDIRKDHCLQLAKKYDIPQNVTRDILTEVEDAVQQWSLMAKEAGLSKKQTTAIAKRISAILQTFNA